MRDSEIVAAIVAGDPEGLAAAYDRYAQALHTYCRSLLAEPADAADAVQDTFVIAASRLAGLRDLDRLKPWLYAVARNECYRRLRARAKMASLEEAGEMTDTSAEAEAGATAGASRAELRALVRAAIAGLNPGDREIIELNLRHDLDGADLADTLGVGPNQAHALQSRARGQFERSLGALLVARSGRADCPELGAILQGWDGQLNVLLRKRVSRHLEQCEQCGQRKRRELSPAMLLSVLPLAVLPPSLRQQVLRLVADSTPDALSYRARLTRQAGRFRADGFPVSIVAVRRRRPWLPNALAASGVAVAGVLLVTAMTLAWPLRHTAATTGLTPRGSPPSAPASAPGSPSGSVPASAAATISPPTTATLPASVSPPAEPPPTTTRTPVGKPTPTPSASTTPGTLSATPTSLTLAPLAGTPVYTGSFTLTAVGGKVAKFTITVPVADVAGLVLTPVGGSLAAGQSVTISVSTTANGPPDYVIPLTVNPGALTVDVRYPPRG